MQTGNTHHRKSIRLKGYDYSKAGLYFITICTENRECLFGEIADDKLILNDIGKIANECWLQIPEHFPNVVLHEHIIMPNHVHGIIELKRDDNVVVAGAENFLPPQDNIGDAEAHPDVGNNDVRPRHGVALPNNTDNVVGTCHGMSTQHPSTQQTTPHPNINQFSKPIPGSVSVIINQYKSSVKRWCNKNGHEYFKWQSRFHDHIIRNQQSYETISDYIISNPEKWKDDKFFTG